MTTIQEAEQKLLVKEQRVSYWEKFGILPSKSDLMFFNDANIEGEYEPIRPG